MDQTERTRLLFLRTVVASDGPYFLYFIVYLLKQEELFKKRPKLIPIVNILIILLPEKQLQLHWITSYLHRYGFG